MKTCGPTDPEGILCSPEVMLHSIAPEIYDNFSIPEGNVFSFGMIIVQLSVGQAVFQKDMEFATCQ
jgi:hypothetical protein